MLKERRGLYEMSKYLIRKQYLLTSVVLFVLLGDTMSSADEETEHPSCLET